MTDEVGRADYLAGETAGAGLTQPERVALDRIRTHLADETAWEEPAEGGQFRLLAAVAAVAAEQSESAEDRTPPPTPSSAAGPSILVTPADSIAEEDPTALVDLFDRRSRRKTKRRWFGAGALVAAALLVAGFVGMQQLADDAEPTDGADELEVAATVELEPTELDPDATATLDVKPTPAGVEFELRPAGLDNAEGGDYYAAWLVGDTDAIPLGSFHWRAGGVPIVLWSGVDDAAYDRFMITRQVAGDGGIPSDEVVLMGAVSVLTLDG